MEIYTDPEKPIFRSYGDGFQVWKSELQFPNGMIYDGFNYYDAKTVFDDRMRRYLKNMEEVYEKAMTS